MNVYFVYNSLIYVCNLFVASVGDTSPETTVYEVKEISCAGREGLVGARKPAKAENCEKLELVDEYCNSCEISRNFKRKAVISKDQVVVKCRKFSRTANIPEIGSQVCTEEKLKFIKKAIDAICNEKMKIDDFLTLVVTEDLSVLEHSSNSKSFCCVVNKTKLLSTAAAKSSRWLTIADGQALVLT